MSDFLWDALLAVPVVLVILWVLKGKLRQREQRHADFQRLASELGLQFNATHMGVREGQAEPPEHATLRNTASSLLRIAGWTNIATALRHHAAHPDQAITCLLTC